MIISRPISVAANGVYFILVMSKQHSSVYMYTPTCPLSGAFPVAQMVKNTPAKQEAWVRCLDGEDPPGGRTVAH